MITTDDAVLVVDLTKLEEMPEIMQKLFEKLRARARSTSCDRVIRRAGARAGGAAPAAGPRLVHVITIATKPDIIKQYPVVNELLRRDELVMVCHTGQHYDHRYSGAMIEEFGLEVTSTSASTAR